MSIISCTRNFCFSSRFSMSKLAQRYNFIIKTTIPYHFIGYIRSATTFFLRRMLRTLHTHLQDISPFFLSLRSFLQQPAHQLLECLTNSFPSLRTGRLTYTNIMSPTECPYRFLRNRIPINIRLIRQQYHLTARLLILINLLNPETF